MGDKIAKIQLRFQCEQEVSEMEIGLDARPFCRMCQRSLVDFRGRPLEEVNKYVSQEGGCGVFDFSHVKQEIYPVLLFSKVRKYVMAFSVLLFSERTYSQSDSSESVVNQSAQVRWGNKMISHEEYEERIKKEREKMLNRELKEKRRKEEIEEEALTTKKINGVRHFSRNERGLFLVKKFPFVTFRRKIFVPNHVNGFW